MKKIYKVVTALLSAISCSALMSAPGHAALFESLLGEANLAFDYGGFIRNENALSITNKENPANQRGNIFNGVSVRRNGAPVGSPAVIIRDTVVRPVETADTQWNLEYVRGQLDTTLSLTENLKFRAEVRAIGDPTIYNDEFNHSDVPTSDMAGTLQREPNYFEYRYDSGRAIFPGSGGRGGEPQDANNDAFEARQLAKLQAEEGSSPLEWAGSDYMVDLPKFYLDYQKGPLLVRLGNQQIAWGDLFFWRIMDKANGLDLRRHSALDFAPEEFSDKRISSLGVRVSYVLKGWEADSYIQRFRPTILPNPETPYNVVPTQFTVHDQFKLFDDEANYGLRLRGPLGPVDVTLMANRRYNHFGVYQWTDSDVVQGLQPNGPAGAGAGPVTTPLEGRFAGELADTPFEVDPTGVTSSREFVTYGAIARLNHVDTLNAAIDHFPASQSAGGAHASSAEEQERQQDFFTQVSGGLRAHVVRDYKRENNFGLGISYKIRGPRSSMFFDEIDADVEISYTPNRKFTATDVSPFDDELIEEDEWEVGLVLQKFIRYSATHPSVFFIFQYLHRTESDIFGRHLSGYDAEPDAADPENRLPTGRSSFDAIAVALQQPSPTRKWRIDFSFLYDLAGGIQVQPGLRWKPSGPLTIQAFVNWVDTVRGNEYNNALSTLDFADEVTTRVEYQF